jgi:drug/metabolite transporter (DMT)-like permease
MLNQAPVYVAAVAVQGLLAIGQVLLKLLAGRLDRTGWRMLSDWATFLHVALPAAATGLVYAITMALWVYVLQNMPLNRAFLFVSLSFVFVPLLAHFLMQEPVGLGTIVGTALIVSGIIVGVLL